MLQPDPTAPARDDAPAVGGPEGDPVQQDKIGTENPIAFAGQHGVAEPPAQESPCSDATLLHEAVPQSDTATGSPAGKSNSNFLLLMIAW